MRQLSPDGSPQGNYGYQCLLEEIMRRPMPFFIKPDDDPFSGFTWERRSLAIQTIARKHASVAVNVNRTADAATLETGAEGLLGWRYEVKGFLSDQGSSDRGITKSPFGDPVEIAATLQHISNKAISVIHKNAKAMTFLMNALDQPGALHILGNATESALKSLPEWADYEVKLKAVCKALGEPDNKKLLLKEMFENCTPSERQLIQKFPNGLCDHKWEHMEDVHEHLVGVLPILIRCFRNDVIDGTLGTVQFLNTSQTIIVS
jgi:hypothetical protein